jgi:hypothetical protein
MTKMKLVKNEIQNEAVHLEIPFGERTILAYNMPQANVYSKGKVYFVEIKISLEVIGMQNNHIYYSFFFLTNHQIKMTKAEITIDLIGEIVAEFKQLVHQEIESNKTIIEKVEGTITLPSIVADVPVNEISTSIFQKIQGLE